MAMQSAFNSAHDTQTALSAIDPGIASRTSRLAYLDEERNYDFDRDLSGVIIAAGQRHLTHAKSLADNEIDSDSEDDWPECMTCSSSRSLGLMMCTCDAE